MSRELQLQLEDRYLRSTSIPELAKQLDNCKDSKIIENMVRRVEAGVQGYHDSVQRKRHAFFSITKSLEVSEVAYIGLKSTITALWFRENYPAASAGTAIGTDLMAKLGRESELHLNEVSIIKDTCAAGIRLLDIVVRSLPSLFRTELERTSGTKTQWMVSLKPKMRNMIENNHELFTIFTRKLRPMVCKPDHWESVTGGGYLSDHGKKSFPLVKRKRNHIAPEGSTVLDAINHIQDTPFVVHEEILEVCKKLEKLKPSAMGKVFLENKGEFSKPCPTDSKVDAHIWEQIVDPNNSEKMMFVHTDEKSAHLRSEFFEWVNEKKNHNAHMVSLAAIERSFASTTQVASEMSKYSELHWSCSLDSRSRVYPSSMTGINIQGSDYQKAVVRFKNALPIGSEDGVFAIKKTLCNHWGHDSGNGTKTDKLNKQQTNKWLDDHSDWIVNCAKKPFKHIQWMSADKPLQFLAAAMEWRDWLKHDEVYGDYSFLSTLADPNDASCSGAQILSAMTRDMVGAVHTNMTDREVQDLYMAVAKKSLQNLKDDFDEMCQDWLGRSKLLQAFSRICKGEGDEILGDKSQKLVKELYEAGNSLDEIFLKVYHKLETIEQERYCLVVRDLVKKPVMVKFYSGTRYGNIVHCKEFLIKKKWKSYFRCDTTNKAGSFIGGMIYDTINEVISGAGQVMEYFVHVAEVLGKAGKPVSWTTPIGFRSTMSKPKYKNHQVKCIFHDDTITKFLIRVPEKTLTSEGWVVEQNVNKLKSGIAPDIVHSLDASLIMAVAARCKQEGINDLWLVHDSLAAHCSESVKFNRIIREEFIRLFEGDVLNLMYEDFKSQLDEEDQGKLMSPEEFGIEIGNYNLEELLDSEFCFR